MSKYTLELNGRSGYQYLTGKNSNGATETSELLQNDCKSITFMPFGGFLDNKIGIYEGNKEVESKTIKELWGDGKTPDKTWKTFNMAFLVSDSDLDFQQDYIDIFGNRHLEQDENDFGILISGKGLFGTINIDEILDLKNITYVLGRVDPDEVFFYDYEFADCGVVLGILQPENEEIENIIKYINENWDCHSFEDWLIENNEFRSLLEKAGIEPVKSEVRRIIKESIKLFDSTNVSIEGSVERLF